MVSSQFEIIIHPMLQNILPSIKVEELSDCTLEESMYSPQRSGKRCGRKRSLDHLTFEEKILRKKLKNREAAQTSRDKKKARMEELEKNVQQLRKKNERLMAEMERLRSEKENTQKENDKLREELKLAGMHGTLERSTSGSAVSVVNPLLKGHRSSQILLASMLLQILQIIYWTAWTTGSGYFQTNSNRNFRIWMNLCLILKTFLNRQMNRKLKNPSLKWWGRHQHCWNPIHQRVVIVCC